MLLLTSLFFAGLAAGESEPIKRECYCPVGRRLLINPELLDCAEDGYDLVPQEREIDCGGGEKKTCQGPGWTCKNDKGDIMDTIDKRDPKPCRCPIGRRRLAINRNLFTCEPHGKDFSLELVKSTHECDNGSEILCDGPGYVCKDGETEKKPLYVDQKDVACEKCNGFCTKGGDMAGFCNDDLECITDGKQIEKITCKGSNTKCSECGKLCIVGGDMAGKCDSKMKCVLDVDLFDKIDASCKKTKTKCSGCAQECATKDGEKGFCNRDLKCVTGDFNFWECNGPDTDCSKEKCGTLCIAQGDLAGECDSNGKCELNSDVYTEKGFCNVDTECAKEKCGASCVSGGDQAGVCDMKGKCELDFDIYTGPNFCKRGCGECTEECKTRDGKKGYCNNDKMCIEVDKFSVLDCMQPDTDCKKEKCGAQCVVEGDIVGTCDVNDKCDIENDIVLCERPDTDCEKEGCGARCVKEFEKGTCNNQGKCEVGADVVLCMQPDTDCKEVGCGKTCIVEGDIAGTCDANNKCDIEAEVVLCPVEEIDFGGRYDNFFQWCSAMEGKEACDSCQGKLVKGKDGDLCAPPKLNKLKCNKVEDAAFCKALGCAYNKNRDRCSKKPKLK